MHTLDQNTSNVPAFLIKVWKLVEDHDCDDLISWSDKGNSFIIRHASTFARNLLPKYFKHNNLASFVRQLNMYGFRKLANYEKCGMTIENDEMEFHHPFFLRGSEDLLELIKRKIPTTKGIEQSSQPKDFLTDLTSIRERQETMNNILLGMKKENELLWRELSSLRQKHKTQEQIIQKVIHFLVTIVQSSKQNIPVKRKIPHMLKDSPTSSAKRSRPIFDVVRGSGGNKDFFFSVSDSDDKASSPKGPVIHEVTEFDHEEIIDADKMSSNAEQQNEDLNPQIESPLSTPANPSSDDNLIFLDSPFTVRSPSLSCEKPTDEEVLGLPFDFDEENVETIGDDIMNAISIPNTTNKTDQQVLNLQISENVTNSLLNTPTSIPVISIPEVPNTNTKTTHVLSIPELSNSINKNPILAITQTTNSTTKTSPIITIKQAPNASIKTSPTFISIPEASNAIPLPGNSAKTSPTFISIPESSNVIKLSGNSVKTNPTVISVPEASNIITLPAGSITNDGKVVIGTDMIPFSPSLMTLIYDNNNAAISKNNLTENASKVIQVKSNSPGKKPSSILIKTENNPTANHKIVTTNSNQLSKRSKLMDSLENQENTMQNNLQLELSDGTTSTDTTLAKTAFSNHILNVDQQLDWLHDELTNSTLNLDSNMLLGLFSSDDSINNAIQSSQLNSEDIGPVKDPDNNIIGNELVQYTPTLDIDDLLYDNFDNMTFLENIGENDSIQKVDAESQNTKPLKSPVIKQEKIFTESCPFENSSKLNQTTPTKERRNRKNLRGRGKRKLK